MGVFITFEGIEGAGKSTQATRLYEYLKSISKKAVLTREPGGTETGKKIREILLSKTQEKFPPKAELFLYEADRNFHIHNVIKPYLSRGFYVICDRFIDSTLAYQGYARGLDINLVKKLNELAVEGVYPDITFLIDIPVDISLKRLGKNKDRIESESRDFHEKLREGFLKIAEENPDRIVVVSGEQPVEIVFSQILDTLKERNLL